MKGIIYLVEVEATVDQARRLHMCEDISKWLPGDFYNCQEAISHNIEQIGRREFESYKEVAEFCKNRRSKRYQDGNRWVAILKVFEMQDDDGELLNIELAPFEEEEL